MMLSLKNFQSLYSLLQQSLNQNQENLDKLLPKVGNVTNNINKMTINVFLNDHCKDAMNISEFMDKVKLTVDDLYYTGENGYIKGITNIFVKNLTKFLQQKDLSIVVIKRSLNFM